MDEMDADWRRVAGRRTRFAKRLPGGLDYSKILLPSMMILCVVQRTGTHSEKIQVPTLRVLQILWAN